MIDKSRWTCASAVADIPDGATVMVGGFGTAGMPDELIDALIEHGARGLTIINNNAGNGDAGLAALIASKRVRKVACSFPRQSASWHRSEEHTSELQSLLRIPTAVSRLNNTTNTTHQT